MAHAHHLSAPTLAGLLTLGACASIPRPCPYSTQDGVCPICRVDSALREEGESIPVPDVKTPPDRAVVPFWSGASLPERGPDPAAYVQCRPCGCTAAGAIEPYREWAEINARAYAQLRKAEAPYPVAVIPGFHAGGMIARYRLKVGLRLLREGWVAALVLSGGYRRNGAHEAKYLYEEAQRLARRLRVDVQDRLFIEPCACHTITNLRNSLRLMAALGLPHGLFVSDAQMTAQAGVLGGDLDLLVDRDLGCPIGRVAFLLGHTPLVRFSDRGNGCRAPLSWSNNPVTFAFPNKRLSVFWVSPFITIDGHARSALECGPGAREIAACEPDPNATEPETCLPVLGRTDLTCEPGT